MWLSRTCWGFLCTMRDAEASGDHEEAEIVVDGKQCWLGNRRIAHVSVMRMLHTMTISEHSDNGSGVQRYRINSLGQTYLRNPGILQDIVRMQIKGGSWHIVDDKLVELSVDGQEDAP